MQLKKNDEIQLNITALTSEGSAIGRKDGVPIFVRGGVPGDVVTAHIIKAKKNYAVARLQQVLESVLPADWTAQQVYDHHEVFMLHGQRCCFFRSPACGRCVLLDLCPEGQSGRATAAPAADPTGRSPEP